MLRKIGLEAAIKEFRVYPTTRSNDSNSVYLADTEGKP